MNAEQPKTTGRNPLELAIDQMAMAFGRPGKAALAAFLSALPADATIVWGSVPEWAATDLIAQQIRAELSHD